MLKTRPLFCLWPESEEADLDDQSSNRLSVRERRRPKERRRGTGINFWTKDVSRLVCAGTSHVVLGCHPLCWVPKGPTWGHESYRLSRNITEKKGRRRKTHPVWDSFGIFLLGTQLLEQCWAHGGHTVNDWWGTRTSETDHSHMDEWSKLAVSQPSSQ